jgi:tRNA(fMet)-specific endonuclease VapC
MVILDTDHFSVLFQGGRLDESLQQRMLASAGGDRAVSIVTVEESCRGWLAKIRSSTAFRKQVEAYEKLKRLLAILADWRVVGVTEAAVEHFERLKKAGVRIGTQDLKIASIALANDALLLTANRRDFTKVPGLRFESWLPPQN